MGQFGDASDATTQQSLFQFASESAGESIHEKNRRSALLDINGLMVSGRLSFSLSYHPDFHHANTVETLLSQFERNLKELITHCKHQSVPKYTASDFPLANLNQTEFVLFNQDNLQDIYPQTPMQQGMLFHTLLQEDKEAYNTQLTLAFKGNIQEAWMKKAWEGLITQFDIFRTGFYGEDCHSFFKWFIRKLSCPGYR